jgi:copper chaperone CopZ
MDAEDRCCDVRPIGPKALPAGTVTVPLRLLVGGMGCEGCTTRVRNALVSLEGVESALVSLIPPMASIRYDPTRLSPEDLVAAVARSAAGNGHQYRAALLGTRGSL